MFMQSEVFDLCVHTCCMPSHTPVARLLHDCGTLCHLNPYAPCVFQTERQREGNQFTASFEREVAGLMESYKKARKEASVLRKQQQLAQQEMQDAKQRLDMFVKVLVISTQRVGITKLQLVAFVNL